MNMSIVFHVNIEWHSNIFRNYTLQDRLNKGNSSIKVINRLRENKSGLQTKTEVNTSTIREKERIVLYCVHQCILKICQPFLVGKVK